MQETKEQSNLDSSVNIFASVKDIMQRFKHMADNEMKLKKMIQKSQKIDLMSNTLPQDKLNMNHSLYFNLFLLFNGLTVGFWMFSNKQYRKFKYFSIYMITMAYFGCSIGILWQDQIFLQKLSTRQEAYKNQIKYLFRKQCLANIQLDRINHKRQLFKKLNSQFEEFHKIMVNQQTVNLLS